MKKKVNKKFNPIFSRGSTKVIKTLDNIIKILFMAFLFLILVGIYIYRKTLIEPYILWRLSFTGVAIGVMLIFIFFTDYKEVFSMIILGSVIGAGLFYSAPLILNRVFANAKVKKETFEIIKTGNLGSGRSLKCRSPYAVIYFPPIKKELIFPCLYEQTIGTYKKVRLEYSEGLFGFPVVRKQTLIE